MKYSVASIKVPHGHQEKQQKSSTGKRVVGRPFKKGVSGNPKGKEPTPYAVYKLKKYTRELVAEMVNELLEMSTDRLSRFILEPDTPALKFAIGKAILREDFNAIDKILDRCIGKVSQKIEHGGPDGAPLAPPSIIFQGVPADGAK